MTTCAVCGAKVGGTANRCPVCNADVQVQIGKESRPRRRLGLLGWFVVLACVAVILSQLVADWNLLGREFDEFMTWQAWILVAPAAVVVMANVAARTSASKRRRWVSWATAAVCLLAVLVSLRSIALLSAVRSRPVDPLIAQADNSLDWVIDPIMPTVERTIALCVLLAVIGLTAAATDRFGREIPPDPGRLIRHRRQPKAKHVSPKSYR